MRKGYTISLLLLLQGLLFIVKAQEPVIQEKRDSSTQEQRQTIITDRMLVTDTVKWVKDDRKVAKRDTVIIIKDEFKPNPTKAVIYSAIFPGLGQIYNRKYWKLPIIYGGAVGLTYAISWNGSKYGDYAQAYKDFVTGEGNSWENFIPFSSNPKDYLNDPSKNEQLKSRLKRNKDMFRQNRDLAIIISVGVYVLCMIDAYVDAQLYDFDISPDISMRVDPVVMFPTQYSKASIGLRCSINF